MVEPLPDWAIPALRLWIRKASKGEKYLAGRWGGARVFIFRNPNPDGKAQAPDYVLCFAKPNNEIDGPSNPISLDD